MSKPQEIETAEFELLISPSASETSVPKPATRSVHVEFGSVSHTGKVRSHNEDHFLVSRYSRKQEVLQTNLPQNCLPEHNGDDGYLFIVADGMGGMAAGEVASRVAISTSLKLLHRSERWGFKVNHREARELFNQINRDLQEVDKTLTEQSAADRRLLGMGTTLTAAYTMGVDLFVVHLGDSRLSLSGRHIAAVDQGPHRGAGDGRRGPHLARVRAPSRQAQRPDQFPRRPQRQGQGRPPMAPPRRRRPAAAVQRRA